MCYCPLEQNKCDKYYAERCNGELCAEAQKIKSEMGNEYKEKKRKELLSLKFINESAARLVNALPYNKSNINEHDYIMKLINDKLDEIHRDISDFEKHYKETL